MSFLTPPLSTFMPLYSLSFYILHLAFLHSNSKEQMNGQDLLGHFGPLYVNLYLLSCLCPTNTPAVCLLQVLTLFPFKNFVTFLN